VCVLYGFLQQKNMGDHYYEPTIKATNIRLHYCPTVMNLLAVLHCCTFEEKYLLKNTQGAGYMLICIKQCLHQFHKYLQNNSKPFKVSRKIKHNQTMDTATVYRPLTNIALSEMCLFTNHSSYSFSIVIAQIFFSNHSVI